MHVSFRSCVRSSSKAMFGFLLMYVPLLLGQTTTSTVGPGKELPDAPMPVTTASPTQNNLDFTNNKVPPSFDVNRTQNSLLMGTSRAIEHPAFKTNALGSKESGLGGKDTKVGGRSPAHLFSFDPIGSHPNRTVTHSGNQWYTSHIPLAGPIMRQGLKISKAHPHLTTVIKTIKPKL